MYVFGSTLAQSFRPESAASYLKFRSYTAQLGHLYFVLHLEISVKYQAGFSSTLVCLMI